jgi:hypothetical protein
MTKKVCRLRWVPGEPLGLHIYEQTTFLHLPREIRDTIYGFSLVTADVITIVSKDHERSVQGSQAQVYSCEPNTTQFKISQLAVNLLFCSRIIAAEAATILYKQNTFRFIGEDYLRGEENWQNFYLFLQGIGAQNRAHLQSLEVGVREPARVWQHGDGSRSSFDGWASRRVYFYEPNVHGKAESFTEGDVHHVDPAIRPAFRLLGKFGEQLNISLLLEPNSLPGVRMWEDEQHRERNSWTMELPQLIERCRRDFCTCHCRCRVAVVWKGTIVTEDFDSQLSLMKEVGWSVVSSNLVKREIWSGLISYTNFVVCMRGFGLGSVGGDVYV